MNTLAHLISTNDVAAVARYIGDNGGIAGLMSADDCGSLSELLGRVRTPAMADTLLQHGLTTTMVGEGWAPGFGMNDMLPPVAEHFVDLGAPLTAHAAAALGLISRLRTMLDDEPDLVHAKGGDGGRPLHFSRDVATAELLVQRGAEIDPHDDDHDSTPAQWRIGDAPEVTRFLLGHGAQADIFMAAAMNDLELATRLLRDHPACTTGRIGHNSGPFPGIGFQGRGGTIYQWTLGFNLSPHEVALRRGHREMYDLLWAHTPPRQQLLVACMLADRATAIGLVAQSPSLIASLHDEDRALLAKCCWETNLNLDAVRLMLDLGFPVDAPEFNHGYLPLHNAAWCGDPYLVDLLLQHGHRVDGRDPSFHATALGFAIHSCVVAKRHPTGDFARVVKLLLAAGVPQDEGQHPTGHAGIDAVLKPAVH